MRVTEYKINRSLCTNFALQGQGLEISLFLIGLTPDYFAIFQPRHSLMQNPMFNGSNGMRPYLLLILYQRVFHSYKVRKAKNIHLSQ